MAAISYSDAKPADGILLKAVQSISSEPGVPGRLIGTIVEPDTVVVERFEMED